MAVTEETTTEGSVTTTTRTGTTPAQVIQDRDPDPSTVNVDETEVHLNVVVTDPAADNAVQLGEPGSLDLPAHDLSGPTPEEVFAADDE